MTQRRLLTGMIVIPSLNVWVADVLEETRLVDDVKPYLLTVLTKHEFTADGRSLVLAYEKCSVFSDFQAIGDWALWLGSFTQGLPHQPVIEACGQMSYARCHEMLFRRVEVFGRLANELPSITRQLNLRIHNALTTSHHASA